MDWKFENEKVELERWVWGVLYKDGTELHQFDDKGVFHRIGEVEQDKVNLFSLYKYEDPSKRIDIPMQKGMRIIYKYRNIKPYYLDHFVRIFLVGYRVTKDSYNYLFILPDDRIIMSPVDNIDLSTFDLGRQITL